MATLRENTKLGAYEIVGPLGAGGMGEVYRARDCRLKREVAIKVLPATFARDTERAARFQREAEVLAALNNPHIAAIYGAENFGESLCLVLELVEGETLANRIRRGRIPVREALEIAKQTAEALEAAHEKGITHRDLKPSNIKVTPDGTVKVLDFGLAKMRESAACADLLNSPTLSASTPGILLGTPSYMSPEQANGQEADHRSDVWAFGCVFYEMLTGRTVFEGHTVGEILAGVMKSQPGWERLPAETPAGVRRLLERCLRKEPSRRLRDIADARLDIEDEQQDPPGPPVRTVGRRKERLAWMLALALTTTVAAGALMWGSRDAPLRSSAPEMRFRISTPPINVKETAGEKVVSVALSPDGRQILFVADEEGQSRLWLCAIDCVSARSLPGTEGALYPFWSPDSRSIGFFADAKLKRMDLDTGGVRPLANATNPRGGAWSGDVILFGPVIAGTPIFRIPAGGGEPVAVTQLRTPQQRGHLHPHFLPDGRHFLYYVLGDPEASGVYVGAIDGSLEDRRLLSADAAAEYAPSGQLLFVLHGTLFAQDFDPAGLTLSGKPFPVADPVPVRFARAGFSVSPAGPIAYRTGKADEGTTQLVRVNRAGTELSRIERPAGMDDHWEVSRDRKRLAFESAIVGKNNIWLDEFANGGLLRQITHDFAAYFPLWSPDGSRIAFSSTRLGHQDLYVESATHAGSEELLLATGQNKIPTDWSVDGKFLLYRNYDLRTAYDIWALPLDRNVKPGTPFPVVHTNHEERDGQFSPDVKWIAYQSNESGRFEIYVQRFIGKEGSSGRPIKVSSAGGTQARWRQDGKELFYVAADGRLTAVSIQFDSDAQEIKRVIPEPLFVVPISGAVYGSRPQYVVYPDGQEFLLNAFDSTQPVSASPITLILNWKTQAVSREQPSIH